MSFLGRFVPSTITSAHRLVQHYHSRTAALLPPRGGGGGNFFSLFQTTTTSTPVGTENCLFQQQWWRGKHTMKTHKGIAKRFKVRGNGSLRRSCAGRQHNTGKKSRHRINKLGQGGIVRPASMERKIKIALGVLGKR